MSLPNIGNLNINSNAGEANSSLSNPSISPGLSIIPIPSEMGTSAYEDDPHVYVNLAAIESKRIWDDIDRRPQPPTPPLGTTPIRVLPNGWQEFKTPGGRTYFYHFDNDFGQWKPPRSHQMTASMLKRQRTNDSYTSNEHDESKLATDDMSSTENIKMQQTTTFPVETSKQAFTSRSPVLGEESAETKQPSSIMSQSMILPKLHHNNVNFCIDCANCFFLNL